MSSSCVVLVPVGGTIDHGCEQGFQGLERRGYPMRRVSGFSAIDLGRCVLASQALRDGFEELMWIDADVTFNPQDVDRLRSHQRPIVCGLYAKKSRRELACDFLPCTRQITFGKEGGLQEIRYAGFGVALTRRPVYEAMRQRLELSDCNQRFGLPITPYFLPSLVPDGAGLWYLSEDYAFCERARQCGFPILADTTIRLGHVGSYAFTWEDAGSDKERFANYTYYLGPPGTSALIKYELRQNRFHPAGEIPVSQTSPDSSGTSAPSERRKFVRYATDLGSFCQRGSEPRLDLFWRIARLHDLSTAGICLYLNVKFDPGTPLVLELNDRASSRQLQARVVHAEPVAEDCWLTGCEITDGLAEGEVQAFLG